jgi:hypothetical protein|tara:strand:+ start:2127 stop:2351 length:225 start_codon:yes stop_codon:yes gene_type:complete
MIKKSLIWDQGVGYLPVFTFGCMRRTGAEFGIKKTKDGTRYTVPKAGRREFGMSDEIRRKVTAAYEQETADIQG